MATLSTLAIADRIMAAGHRLVMRVFSGFVLAAFLLATLPARLTSADESLSSEEEEFIGVRVLKTPRANPLEWSVELPDCAACRPLINEITSAQNPREFYFHFFAPKRLETVRVRVRVPPSKVRAVVVGRTRVPFTRTATGILFDAPRPEESDRVAELHTFIDTPAVRLRIEHADEQRRRGPYAAGRWPAVERQAALNLQFAAREAVTSLRLDRSMRDRNLGVIQLMGFDTNYPTLDAERAHADHPPHWHMHVYWTTEPKIRVIDHQFIDAAGLLTHNHVARNRGVDPTQRQGRFERGQTLDVLTPGGELLFTQTITSEGHFVLGTPSATCRFLPVGGGYHHGVELRCDGSRARRIRATDDLARGRVRLFIDDRPIEQHFYDIDTGVLRRSMLPDRSR